MVDSAQGTHLKPLRGPVRDARRAVTDAPSCSAAARGDVQSIGRGRWHLV